MTDEHRMEQLSRAYVQAVAAVAGCTCARPEPDYGNDITLRRIERVGHEFVAVGRNLDIQLKSTTRAELTGTEVIYDLDVRAYNILRRSTRRAPIYLVLLVLPPDHNDWMSHSEDRLELRVLVVTARAHGRAQHFQHPNSHPATKPVNTGGTDADNGSSRERGGRMTRSQWPTPEQIGAYLATHGWRFDRPMKHPGAVYVYHQRSDAGNPIELFVPDFAPHVDVVEDFASSVLAVVETLQALEQRSGEAVLADMLATDLARTPRTPPVPVP